MFIERTHTHVIRAESPDLKWAYSTLRNVESTPTELRIALEIAAEHSVTNDA